MGSGDWRVCAARNNLVFGALTLAVISALLFTWSNFQRFALEQSWPNSTKAMAFLTENVSSQDKILVESDDVALLALSAVVAEESVTGAFIFSYQDQDGLPAYGKAVNDGYFDVIELDSMDSELAMVVEKNLNERYSLIYEQDPFRIYRLKLP